MCEAEYRNGARDTQDNDQDRHMTKNRSLPPTPPSAKVFRRHGALLTVAEQHRLAYHGMRFRIEAEAVAVRTDRGGFADYGIATFANLVIRRV